MSIQQQQQHAQRTKKKRNRLFRRKFYEFNEIIIIMNTMKLCIHFIYFYINKITDVTTNFICNQKLVP